MSAGSFGDICNSTGPDTCFAFRFCATHERFIHYDRALGVVYASDRSTGLGYLRGGGGDFDDFVKAWQSRPWLDAAPIPGLNLGLNLLFHEYEFVRKATSDPEFPPIDKTGYLRDLARGLQFIEDRDARRSCGTFCGSMDGRAPSKSRPRRSAGSAASGRVCSSAACGKRGNPRCSSPRGA